MSNMLAGRTRVLQESEQYTRPEKRQAFHREVARLGRSFIQELILCTQLCSNGGWEKIAAPWHALYQEMDKVERSARRQELRYSFESEDIKPNLYWMVERGEEEDPDLLKELRAKPPYTAPDIQHLLDIAIQEIHQRVNDPDYVMEKGEAAYQAHQEDWDEQYKNQFIAIHRGTVIDSDIEKPALVDRLMKKQKEEGPFRAYIVHVGEPVLTVRGPKSKRAGQRHENTEE